MTEAPPFTRQEALDLWAWIVAGFAENLDPEGARTLYEGVKNPADSGGSYEGVTRMLWGLGSWLSYPDRPAIVTHNGVDYDVEAITRRAYVNACNPDSPSFWGIDYLEEPHTYDQRTVESGQVAFALWQSRERIWDKLSETEQTHIFDWLERFGSHPVNLGNNWSLFWALNHASRKALELPYDQQIIDDVLGTYLDRVYCGDGWYDDWAECGMGYFDEYNIWVFASHVLCWAQVDGDNAPELRDKLLERIRLRMQHVPYFYAANGATVEFGRSLSYKFARLGAPLWAHHLGVWDQSVGMLKRLVGRHLRWYVERGAIREDGSIMQSLTADGSIDIRERYISTGATYWAMQAFGGLWSLPDDDPFWTVAEEPLPAETEDYVKVYPQPGWVVTANNGEVQLFNGGSVKDIGPKYAKFAYSTLNPFNVGMPDDIPTPDNMLSIVDGATYGQRTKNYAYAVGEAGWLRVRWAQEMNGAAYNIDTIIVVDGAQHVRAHKVLIPLASAGTELGEVQPVSAVEGGFPLGHAADETPTLAGDIAWQTATLGSRMSGIANIRGYVHSETQPGVPDVHSTHALYKLPTLTVPDVTNGLELMCLVHNGAPAANLAEQAAQIMGQWADDGSFTYTRGTTVIVVPPLE